MYTVSHARTFSDDLLQRETQTLNLVRYPLTVCHALCPMHCALSTVFHALFPMQEHFLMTYSQRETKRTQKRDMVKSSVTSAKQELQQVQVQDFCNTV